MADQKLPVLLAALLIPLVSLAQNLNIKSCSRGGMATIQPNSDAFIGGIISLNAPGTGGYGCGKPSGDMQAYEALRWVLDLLNKVNETINTQYVTDYYVPGIRLGMMVKNYCGRELSAVASVADIFPEQYEDGVSCTPGTNFTLGIIGASTSGDAATLSINTMRHQIPIVSYEATATQLTMSGKYPNFMRTIAPDGPLMGVIVQVMTRLQWKFVAVVYSSDDYGRQAFQELQARLIASEICLTAGIMVDSEDESTATDTLNRVLATDTLGVVYLGPGSYAEAIIKAGNAMLPAAGRLQWLLTEFELDAVFSSSSVYQRGIIVISAASRYIAEFEDHWIRLDESNPSLENPWFTGWYEDKFNCLFSPTAGQTNCNSLYAGMSANDKELKKRAEFRQSSYVESAVMSVYTYAKALRNAQMELCPGVSGACSALKSLSQESFMNKYLKKVNVTFTADERVPTLASNNVPPYNAAKRLSYTPYGDISDPSYDIYNYNDVETGNGAKTFKFRQVGSYVAGYLNLNLDNVAMYNSSRQTRLQPLPSSACPARGCSPCLGLPADFKYYFEDGDLIVHGLFSLHRMGLTPLTCGPVMSVNQYMFLEAMIYAVASVNKNNSILHGLRLGGLGMDDCSSSTLGRGLLAQVQRGNLQIVDGAGRELEPRKIEAYSAADTTKLTLPLAEAMNSLMRPMVGYRAGGSELDNQSKYPYFLRAFPGNYEEMKAIVLFLQFQKWMYVQVVTSLNEYSQDAEHIFRDLASRAGICIVATHNMGQGADNIVMGLGVNMASQPTVVLLTPQDARSLLVALNQTLMVRERIVLIGSSMWGKDDSVIRDLSAVAQGAITISPKSSTLANFKNYLASLDVSSYTLNPWFKEWYTAAHNCSLAGQGSGAPCNLSKPITEGVNFQLLYQVDGVINAIRAVGYGLSKLLGSDSYCGANFNAICSTFLTSENKGMNLVEAIRSISFNIEDMTLPNEFSFTGNSAKLPFEIYNVDSGSYTLIGEIQTQITLVSLLNQNIRLYGSQQLASISSSCIGQCNECPLMPNSLDYWYLPGDLVIGAIFDVHYAGSGPLSCGALRARNGALYTEVFKYALDVINQGSSSIALRNVTLGGLMFDGCTSARRAMAILSHVHTGNQIMDASGSLFQPADLISWMSYDSQSTIDTASLLQTLDMPIVSPGATSRQLDNKQKFKTFFRTIPSDSQVVRGMAEFVRAINKNYIVVLNAPDTSSRESRDLFKSYLTEFGICVVAAYEFDTDGSMDIIVKNIYDTQSRIVAVFADPDRYIDDFLSAKTRESPNNDVIFVANRPWSLPRNDPNNIVVHNSVFFDFESSFDGFLNYLRQQWIGTNNNPWFTEIYQKIMDCDLSKTFHSKVCSNSPMTSVLSSDDIWTIPTIHAVSALAKAVHETLQLTCGLNYSGVCPEFLANSSSRDLIMASMDAESFTDVTNILFQFIQREANTVYRLMRYNYTQNLLTTNEEGRLNGTGSLTLLRQANITQQYTGVMSQCLGDCLVCSAQKSDLQDLTLIFGDIYIIGLFDVHKQGNTPFTCGDINDKRGLPLLEAFNYAINYINDKNGMFKNILPGVLLGGVGLDVCQSPSRAAQLVANIHSGYIKLSKDGNDVDPRKVDAYVGTFDTEGSIRVADILRQLAIPQISFGATGMDLLNRQKYSYFLRSVPADDKQARAIVSYLKKFEYNNIQVIYSFDEVGEPGMKEFKRLAYVNKICITKEYLVGDNGDMTSDAQSAMNTISQYQTASVVVLWLKDPLPILEAANNVQNVYKNMLFIATDKWGADADYLTISKINNILAAKNLIILDVETADIPGFDDYLDLKNPDNYKTNPWFLDYFEMFENCYWEQPSGTRQTPCDKSSRIPRQVYYKQDEYTLYVINAVFSAAMGIHNAISKLCGNIGQADYYGICNLYTSSGERRQNVLQGLLKVNFTDDTNQPFYFTEDGQSSRGFHFYNVTSVTTTEFQYTNVGSYNDTNFLKLDIVYSSNYKAQCGANEAACTCTFEENLPSRYMKKAEAERGLSVVYIGDIHQASSTGPLTCGPINTGLDLEKLLAFFYAIDQVNSLTVFSNSLKLDGLALDSCTHATRLGQDVYNVLSGNQLCGANNDGLIISPSTITAFVIDKDHNAIPVASMLSEQNITSISPTAGSAVLNDRFIYPYFLRTHQDNLKTAEVILQVVQNVSWDYVNILYTDDSDYSDMVASLLDRSRQASVCFGVARKLPVAATQADMEQALQQLSTQVGARAVVLMLSPEQLKLLLQASQNLGLTGRFIWLVVANAEQALSQLYGLEAEFAGAIIVDFLSGSLTNFTNYVKSLTYTNRAGIPDDWFDDIYETLHQCNILNPERPSANRFSKICTLNEVLTDSMIPQDASILHVMISVYAIAYGLNNIPECTSSQLDLSACLQLLPQRYNSIHQGISSVSFTLPYLPGSFLFKFDDNGNGNLDYLIKNYRISPSNSTAPYMVYEIGNYSTQSGLYLAKNQYAAGNLFDREIPSSNCARGLTCTCQLSGSRTWSYSATQVFDPARVKIGETYKDPTTGLLVTVQSIPTASQRFSEGWAIILAILAALGALVTLVIFVYLLITYPKVKGTTILGYILCFGILMLYLMVFPFIAHASEQMCGLRRFGLGFVYSIVYSALLIKLIDNLRVKSKEDMDNVKYNKLGSPTGLFMVAVFLVLIQVIINAEWLILETPNITRIFYEDQYWPRCSPDDFYDEGLVLSLVYVMVIIFVSLLLGLVTFSTSINHRESRWILVILVISVICWVVWCTASILGAKKMRDAAVAIGLLVNATAMLLLMPVYKIYLLHHYGVPEPEEEHENLSTFAPSHKSGDYNSVYGRQYDNKPRLHDAGSTRVAPHFYTPQGSIAGY